MRFVSSEEVILVANDHVHQLVVVVREKLLQERELLDDVVY